jgi:hypothetical protein
MAVKALVMVRAKNRTASIVDVMKAKQKDLLETWLGNIRSLPRSRALELTSENQLRKQTADLLKALVSAFSSEQCEDTERPEFAQSVAVVRDIGAACAEQGFTATEATTYILLLKDALLQCLQAELSDNPELLNTEAIKMNKVFDKLGLVTLEAFIQNRRDVVANRGRSPRDRERFSGICNASKDAMESASLDEILLAIADSLCELMGCSVATLLARRKYHYPTSKGYHEYASQAVERFLGTKTAGGPLSLTLLLQQDRRERKEEANGQQTDSG